MTEITHQQLVEWLDKYRAGRREFGDDDMFQAIRAALTEKAVIDEGELWSFLRHVLVQGEAIWQDNKDKCYEEYSAHLDYAARVRMQQLVKMISGNRGNV